MSWPVSSLTQTTETTLPSNFGSLAFIVCLRSNDAGQAMRALGARLASRMWPRSRLH
jgi:hypothetical protein